ncbi:MAG: hypothetical protein M0Z94_16265 [Dehalococcoidales bacterium]|nr:hypothetical protein [Dehalococcoidales bacterium]
MQQRQTRHEGARRVGYGATVVVNLILLYIMNNLLAWHFPFLTDSFVAVLWVMNLSLLAGIVGNALLLAYDDFWFHQVVRIATNIFGFAVVYTLLVIFPFDLPEAWDIIVRIALVAALVGIGIGTLVESVRLVFVRDRR